jgi:enamine deaminase RidA (YjgF/YER057c/UK114 family)
MPSRSTAGASSRPDADRSARRFQAAAADIEGQTVRVMENLKIVLGGLELGLEHVIVARVYITDFEANYPRMNAVYASYFPADRRPGADLHRRQPALQRGAMVEIDVLAKR